MASVDWQKIKGGTEAKAMFRHCDTEKRVASKHTNADIDVTRTYLNMEFGAFDDGYDKVCEEYDSHIEALDAKPGANKRKDRVTLVGWSIPVPEGMDEDKAREWCVEAYRVMCEQYGDTVLGGSAHFDEIHEYTDAETGARRESRPHLHMYAVPEVDGKLNAKAFMSRRNMVAANNAMEAMTQERFPGYRFQTGAKKKSRRTVEELKQASDVRAIEDAAQAEAARIVEEARKRADDIEAKAVLDAEQTAKTYKNMAAMEYHDIMDIRRGLSKTLTEAEKDLKAIQDTLVQSEGLKTALSASQSDELSRAKDFMGKYRLKDGSTVLDKFEDEERKRAQAVQQGTSKRRDTLAARANMLSGRIAQHRDVLDKSDEYGD